MRPRQHCCIQFFMGEGMATLIAKKTQKCMRGAAGYKLSAVPCDLGYYPLPSLKPIPSPPLFHSPSICVPPMLLIWMGSSQWIRSSKGSRKRKMHVIFNLAPCMLFMIHELHQACMTLSAIFFGALSVLVPLEGVDRQMATESSMEGLHVHFYSMEAMACLVHSICHKIEILWEW